MNLDDNDIIMVERINGAVNAWIVRGGDQEASMEPLPPTDAALRISPTGFFYDYGGSGPAVLAHSILAACCGKVPANAWYHDYKRQRLEGETAARWTVKVGTVRQWVEHQRRHARNAR